MHFKDDVIAFIGPACAFALEPVARLAAYWNTPIITGMGDQASDISICVKIILTKLQLILNHEQTAKARAAKKSIEDN